MTKKTINFDLSQDMLRKHYPKKNITYAYFGIKSFLSKSGFEHIQGSGYVSEKPISIVKVNAILSSMQYKFPWLCDCVEAIRIANVQERFFDGKAILLKARENISDHQKIKKDKHFSR